MVVMIPVANAHLLGIRPIVSAEDAQKALETLGDEIEAKGVVQDLGVIVIVDDAAYELYSFSKSIADKYAAVVNYTAEALDGRANVYDMIVPTSVDITMPDSERAKVDSSSQADAIRYIFSCMSAQVHSVNVYNTLRSHRTEYIYFRTDHHWTSLGAYYAFAASASRLGEDVLAPSFTLLPVTDEFEGTLASQSGVHRTKDTISVYLPQDTGISYYVNYPDAQTRVTSLFVSSALEEKDKYTVFFGGNHPLVEVFTTVNNGRSLLVLKDSYANSFIQFLTTYYDKIILIDPRYYYDDLSTALTTYGITDVLFLYSGDYWMTDSTLTDVLATG